MWGSRCWWEEMEESGLSVGSPLGVRRSRERSGWSPGRWDPNGVELDGLDKVLDSVALLARARAMEAPGQGGSREGDSSDTADGRWLRRCLARLPCEMEVVAGRAPMRAEQALFAVRSEQTEDVHPLLTSYRTAVLGAAALRRIRAAALWGNHVEEQIGAGLLFPMEAAVHSFDASVSGSGWRIAGSDSVFVSRRMAASAAAATAFGFKETHTLLDPTSVENLVERCQNTLEFRTIRIRAASRLLSSVLLHPQRPLVLKSSLSSSSSSSPSSSSPFLRRSSPKASPSSSSRRAKSPKKKPRPKKTPATSSADSSRYSFSSGRFSAESFLGMARMAVGCETEQDWAGEMGWASLHWLGPADRVVFAAVLGVAAARHFAELREGDKSREALTRAAELVVRSGVKAEDGGRAVSELAKAIAGETLVSSVRAAALALDHSLREGAPIGALGDVDAGSGKTDHILELRRKLHEQLRPLRVSGSHSPSHSFASDDGGGSGRHPLVMWARAVLSGATSEAHQKEDETANSAQKISPKPLDESVEAEVASALGKGLAAAVARSDQRAQSVIDLRQALQTGRWDVVERCVEELENERMVEAEVLRARQQLAISVLRAGMQTAVWSRAGRNYRRLLRTRGIDGARALQRVVARASSLRLLLPPLPALVALASVVAEVRLAGGHRQWSQMAKVIEQHSTVAKHLSILLSSADHTSNQPNSKSSEPSSPKHRSRKSMSDAEPPGAENRNAMLERRVSEMDAAERGEGESGAGSPWSPVSYTRPPTVRDRVAASRCPDPVRETFVRFAGALLAELQSAREVASSGAEAETAVATLESALSSRDVEACAVAVEAVERLGVGGDEKAVDGDGDDEIEDEEEKEEREDDMVKTFAREELAAKFGAPQSSLEETLQSELSSAAMDRDEDGNEMFRGGGGSRVAWSWEGQGMEEERMVEAARSFVASGRRVLGDAKRAVESGADVEELRLTLRRARSMGLDSDRYEDVGRLEARLVWAEACNARAGLALERADQSAARDALAQSLSHGLVLPSATQRALEALRDLPPEEAIAERLARARAMGDRGAVVDATMAAKRHFLERADAVAGGPGLAYPLHASPSLAPPEMYVATKLGISLSRAAMLLSSSPHPQWSSSPGAFQRSSAMPLSTPSSRSTSPPPSSSSSDASDGPDRQDGDDVPQNGHAHLLDGMPEEEQRQRAAQIALERLAWSPDLVPVPLTRTRDGDAAVRAAKSIAAVCGDRDATDLPTLAAGVVQTAIARPDLRDEILLLALRHTRRNLHPSSRRAASALLLVLLHSVLPSPALENALESFLLRRGRTLHIRAMHTAAAAWAEAGLAWDDPPEPKRPARPADPADPTSWAPCGLLPSVRHTGMALSRASHRLAQVDSAPPTPTDSTPTDPTAKVLHEAAERLRHLSAATAFTDTLHSPRSFSPPLASHEILSPIRNTTTTHHLRSSHSSTPQSPPGVAAAALRRKIALYKK